MEIEFEKELLDLKAECRENPNIHPHFEHVVDLAISEIKRLEQQYETDTVWFHDKQMRAEKKLRELASRTRWIPVSERLPEEADANEFGYALVVTIYGSVRTDKVEWVASEEGRKYFTHWMPLPKPPHEVE